MSIARKLGEKLIAALGPEFLKYAIASIAALAADMLVFSALIRVAGWTANTAATFGFLVGVTVAYAISVNWVFAQRNYRQNPTLEIVSFILIGIAGLAVTQAVLWVGVTQMHLMPEFVKLLAAGATFAFNFLVRKFMLFRASAAAAALVESRL